MMLKQKTSVKFSSYVRFRDVAPPSIGLTKLIILTYDLTYSP